LVGRYLSHARLIYQLIQMATSCGGNRGKFSGGKGALTKA
jgi:hypothetical protein